jgi:hypothetical protein
MLEPSERTGGLVCPNGHENPPGLEFCGHCGTALVAAQGGHIPVATGVPASTAPAAPIRRRSSRRLVAIVALAVVALLAVGGLSVALTGDNGYTLRGLMFLNSTSHSGTWDTCEGTGGYDDVSTGGNVSVTDGKHNTIGGGRLGNVADALIPTLVTMDRQSSPSGQSGHVIGLKSTDDTAAAAELKAFLQSSAAVSCVLYYEARVPKSDFYSIEVTHRGALDYSFDEMSKKGFVVGSSVGNFQ